MSTPKRRRLQQNHRAELNVGKHIFFSFSHCFIELQPQPFFFSSTEEKKCVNIAILYKKSPHPLDCKFFVARRWQLNSLSCAFFNRRGSSLVLIKNSFFVIFFLILKFFSIFQKPALESTKSPLLSIALKSSAKKKNEFKLTNVKIVS